MLNLLLFLWVISLVLGQFARVFSGEFGGIYLSDFFCIAFDIFTFFYLLIKHKTKFLIPKIYIPFIAFSFWNILSLLYNWQFLSFSELTYSLFYFVRLVSYVLGGLLLVNCYKNKLIKFNVLNLILFYSLFFSISGFIQLIVFPNFSKLDASLGWDPHVNRLLGTLFDPNFMGATLVLCFNVVFAHLKKERSAVLFFSLITILVAILLTFSRSSWLMLSVSIFIWGIVKYPKLLVISIFVAFMAYFAVPRIQTRISSITDPADSAHFRIISWKNTLKIAQDNPFFGVGYNSFRFAQKEFGFFGVDWGGRSGGGADSSFLLILATTGIIGFLLFNVFLFFPVLKGLFLAFSNKKNGEKPNDMSYIYILLATFPALAINSFFINSIFYPQILFLWNIILAKFILSYIEC